MYLSGPFFYISIFYSNLRHFWGGCKHFSILESLTDEQRASFESKHPIRLPWRLLEVQISDFLRVVLLLRFYVQPHQDPTKAVISKECNQKKRGGQENVFFWGGIVNISPLFSYLCNQALKKKKCSKRNYLDLVKKFR